MATPRFATPVPARTAWRDRAVLAGAATLTTGAVLAWAGAQPWTAGAGAVGAGAVVLVAAWVATTIPGRPHPAEPGGQRPGGRPSDRAEHEDAGPDPVE